MEGGVAESTMPSAAVQQSPLLGVNSQATTNGRGYGAMNNDGTSNLAASNGSSLDVSSSQGNNRHNDASPAATCTVHLPSYSDATAEAGGQRRKGQRDAVCIDLRKLVFATMCIPTPTRPPSQCHRNCVTVSCLMYFFLSVIGCLITLVTARSNDLTELSRAKVIAICAGVFFMLLDIYWVALYWWYRLRRCNTPLHQRDFSVFGFFWWFLSMYFVTVLAFLVDEILRKYSVFFGSSASNTKDKPDSGKDGGVVMVKAALICMILYLYFCTVVFLVMKLGHVVYKRWTCKSYIYV